MISYYVAMDYDHVCYTWILMEMITLKLKFRIPFYIMQSSSDSYHIRSDVPLTQSKCMEIMDYSNCSQDYKDYAHRLGSCPIRQTVKTNRLDGIKQPDTPKPRLIFSC